MDLSYMELEGQWQGIIMEVTRSVLLGQFYKVKWPITPNKSAGSVCRHFVFRQVDIMGAVCWDPNYTPGLDFLDHNFLPSKYSG